MHRILQLFSAQAHTKALKYIVEFFMVKIVLTPYVHNSLNTPVSGKYEAVLWCLPYWHSSTW